MSGHTHIYVHTHIYTHTQTQTHTHDTHTHTKHTHTHAHAHKHTQNTYTHTKHMHTLAIGCRNSSTPRTTKVQKCRPATHVQGSDQKRQAFSKRKRGIVLKAYQLYKLTDAKVRIRRRIPSSSFFISFAPVSSCFVALSDVMPQQMSVACQHPLFAGVHVHGE